MENLGIYMSLVAQLDKLARHNRQGSFRTKERYYEAMKRFCRFLAEEYRLKTCQHQRQASHDIHLKTANRRQICQHD